MIVELESRKAILIDMDGTIVDSHPILIQVYLDFMNKMGVEGSEEEFQELVGPSLPEVVVILRERYGIDISTEDLVGRYHQSLETVYTGKLELFDGVVEFLAYVKEKGMKVALVTSATQQLAHKFIVAQEIDSFFDCVVTPNDGKGKPAPDIYLRALEEVGCRAGEAVVIEDSPNGVQAAVSAGIATLHIFDTKLPVDLKNNPLVTSVDNWHTILKMCEETHGGI